ncbi:MAG: SDR family oxidoreductase [Alphaproteobacteria bacterium]|nr:SDR family oxidoreductase [Alphaproteobacteria bacterium]
MTFQGQTALITGAGRGLGRALAVALAARGATVIGVARTAAELDAVVAGIRASGGDAHAIVADLHDPEAPARVAAQAAALTGAVDLLIHNASTLGPTPLPLLLDTWPEDFERVLAVNLLAPFRLTRALLGGMALRGQGAVVFISSDAAVEAYPTWGAYGVSKAALDHLARTFAAEHADGPLRFLAVDPGEMNTAMHAAAIPDADPASLQDPADVARRVLALLASEAPAPVRRLAQEVTP